MYTFMNHLTKNKINAFLFYFMEKCRVCHEISVINIHLFYKFNEMSLPQVETSAFFVPGANKKPGD